MPRDPHQLVNFDLMLSLGGDSLVLSEENQITVVTPPIQS